MKDKISKIDKLENSHKAQAIIKEAQSASVATKSANPQKKKPAKSTFAKPKNNAPLKPQKATQKKAEKAGKKANKKALKGVSKSTQKASAKSGQKSLTLGVITISADTKKLAKISAFFNDFIANAEEKSEFVKKALLAQIKKHKKKHK